MNKNKLIVSALTLSLALISFGGLVKAEEGATVTPIITSNISAIPAVTSSPDVNISWEDNNIKTDDEFSVSDKIITLDVNNNGIPDIKEDFDEDGILNGDDVDYYKKYVRLQALPALLNKKNAVRRISVEASDRAASSLNKNKDALKNVNDRFIKYYKSHLNIKAIIQKIRDAKTDDHDEGLRKKLRDTIKKDKKLALKRGEARLANRKLYKRLRGKIILKVQDRGRAYYVNPKTATMRSLGRPADAFAVMREEGLGVSNNDLNSWKGRAPKKLAGRILLKVQDKGQAYYVNPSNLKLIYLKRPADAFNIMKNLGLGISNNDFSDLFVDSSVK